MSDYVDENFDNDETDEYWGIQRHPCHQLNAQINDIKQIEFSDGSFYQGQVNECLLDFIVAPCMHGKGVYTIAGSKYVGDFLNNKPDGEVFFSHADGQSYEGDFSRRND